MVDAAVGIVGAVGIKRSWGSSFSSAQTIKNNALKASVPLPTSSTDALFRMILNEL
jgi:hypothetical protein